MKKTATWMMVLFLAAPLAAFAETWKDVSVVDGNCLSKVKADPDKHTVKCALQCVKGGYGLLTSDGSYLKFDEAGNAKTVAALKATKKEDHVRATVIGERSGDSIKVASITIE
jgi:hypothetical protein